MGTFLSCQDINKLECSPPARDIIIIPTKNAIFDADELIWNIEGGGERKVYIPGLTIESKKEIIKKIKAGQFQINIKG